MKMLLSKDGPFKERPYFTTEEIESLCNSELKKVGLFPTEPSPIRVERFIEKRFGSPPRYESLPDGVLGYTSFGHRGVDHITVSTALSESSKKTDERRLNSTLAHEAGHGLLHAQLFCFIQDETLSSDFFSEGGPRILCRESGIQDNRAFDNRGYGGRWWEYQANLVIGALLLPKTLIIKALNKVVTRKGTFGELQVASDREKEAIAILSEVFEVNPIVARIRVIEMRKSYCKQLTL